MPVLTANVAAIASAKRRAAAARLGPITASYACR